MALPGLLFHHETLTKDDYHDRMVPWTHYVPIRMDLANLKDKFDWAEAHPERAQEISRAATKLARNWPARSTWPSCGIWTFVGDWARSSRRIPQGRARRCNPFWSPIEQMGWSL